MATDPQSNKVFGPALTPDRAVSIGQLVVNLPVVCIMALGGLLAYLLKGPAWTALGILLGIVPAWLWWSFMVPRWREWAKHQGADEDETQLIGERRGLLWRKGSFFERTEFGSRNKSEAERQIKQSSVEKPNTMKYWPALLFVGGLFFVLFGTGAYRYIRGDNAFNRLLKPEYHPWAIVVGLLMILRAYRVKDGTD